MGCGASKSPETVAPVSVPKPTVEGKQAPTQEVPSKTAGSPPPVDASQPSVSKSAAIEGAPPASGEPEQVQVASAPVSGANPPGPAAKAGSSREPEAAADVKAQPVDEEAEVERPVQAAALVEEPDKPSTPPLPSAPPERSSAPERAQDPAESPRTRARFDDDEGSEQPAPRPALAAFKSSRSLNRSFGVKRRESDVQDQPAAESTAAKEEAEVDAEPDPLREEFEKMKAASPWLVGVTQKSTAKSLMGERSSDPKSKCSKRPSVGFALNGGADDDDDDDGEGTDVDDVDPEAHMEAERIASTIITREEVPVPVQRLASQTEGATPEGGEVRPDVRAAAPAAAEA